MFAALLTLPGALGTRPTAARAGGGPVTTNLFLPFADTLTTPTDTFQVVGRVHVLVQAPTVPIDPCRIDTNVQETTAVSMRSGRVFQAVGSASFSFPESPPNTYDFVGQYPLAPIDPCRCALPLAFSIVIKQDGTVDTASVSIHGSLDHP
jgi:hypothetical protein